MYGEIEIRLYHSRPESYNVEVRVTDPDSDVEIAPAQGLASFALDQLSDLEESPDQYGTALAEQLFEDPAIRQFWLKNQVSFDSRGRFLRLRILIDPSVPELHTVRWELLRDPESKLLLATSERILFSRFLLSDDWRVVKLRPRAKLKALIAVAAPTNLDEWSMAPVDYAGEVARAQDGLAGIETSVLENERPLTLDRLMEGLRNGADILYLVCHGSLKKGKEATVFLQNAAGETEPITAGVLAQRVGELQEPPRLVVLASCESAKPGDSAHAALAPRLAEAGVPAILAMQGRISMETVKQAIPVFFRELIRDGQIDRAMAVARGVVRERFDAWMPALFLRLRGGRIMKADADKARTPHQIPSPPADFAGRAREMVELRAAARSDGAVFAAIQGQGGSGKTGLALRFAAEIAPDHLDGEIYVNLRGASDAPLKPSAAMTQVIRALDAAAKLPDSEAELAGFYLSALQGKRVLLLMDDARDAAQIKPLVPPRGSSLLVTSRMHFKLPGMYLLSLETLPPEDAEAYLVTAEPRIGTEAAEIAKLCGYLPLALELAARALAERVDLTPANYTRRLANEKKRLKQLTSGEDSVEASINLSYSLLHPEAQEQWRGLSVFPDTFDAGAAAAVWNLEDADDASDVLSSFVQSSMIQWKDATRRYRVHDLMRDFARARVSAEEARHAALRHSRHYLGVLGETERLYDAGGDSVLRGLQLFDLEWNNVEAGQAWASNNFPDDESAAQLCKDYAKTGVGSCAQLRIHVRRKISWTDAGLAAARTQQDLLSERVLLTLQGFYYAELGDYNRETELFEQLLALARGTGTRWDEASALNNLGFAHTHKGQNSQAIASYEQALAIAREIGDRTLEGQALESLGGVYEVMGDTSRAIECTQQALAIARENKDPLSEDQALSSLASATGKSGRMDEAIQGFEQALAYARTGGDRRGEASALRSLGGAWQSHGEMDRAIELFRDSLKISRELGDRNSEGDVLENLGYAFSEKGAYTDALPYLEQGLAITRESGQRGRESHALGLLGYASYQVGDFPRALEFRAQALAIHRKAGDRKMEWSALMQMGLCHMSMDEPAIAAKLIEEGVGICRETGDIRDEAEALRTLGMLLPGLGDHAREIECLERRLAIARQLGDGEEEIGVLEQLGAACKAQQDIRAVGYFKELLAAAIETADLERIYGAYANLGDIALAVGEPDGALHFYNRLLEVARQFGNKRQEMEALESIFRIAMKQNQPEQAIRTAETMVSVLRDAGDRANEGVSLFFLGEAILMAGDRARAVSVLESALEIMRETGDSQADAVEAQLLQLRA